MNFAVRRDVGPALAWENRKDDDGHRKYPGEIQRNDPFRRATRPPFRPDQPKTESKIMSQHHRLPLKKRERQKQPLRFGDLIAAVYKACGDGRAKGILAEIA
jgi:hypothetical protein